MVACLPTAVCTSADVLQLFLGFLFFFPGRDLRLNSAKRRTSLSFP